MRKAYQVTIFSHGEIKYKPIATIVQYEQNDNTDYSLRKCAERSEIINKGITKICLKNRWSGKDLKKDGFTGVKVRAVK